MSNEVEIAKLNTSHKYVTEELKEMKESLKEILAYQKDTNGKTNKAIDWIDNFEKEGYKTAIKSNSKFSLKFLTIGSVIMTFLGGGGLLLIRGFGDYYLDKKFDEIKVEISDNVTVQVDNILEEYEFDIVE